MPDFQKSGSSWLTSDLTCQARQSVALQTGGVFAKTAHVQYAAIPSSNSRAHLLVLAVLGGTVPSCEMQLSDSLSSSPKRASFCF